MPENGKSYDITNPLTKKAYFKKVLAIICDWPPYRLDPSHPLEV